MQISPTSDDKVLRDRFLYNQLLNNMNSYMYIMIVLTGIGGVMVSEWSDIFAADRCFSELACTITISQGQSEHYHHLIDCYLFS